MANELDDFGKSIAENIGYMPAVMGAGKAGGSFMDFLGSLLGGSQAPAQPAAKAPAPAPAATKTNMQPDFLSGLWNAITSGAQSTMDAARDDFGNVQEGKLPQHAVKDAKTALMMTGRGGFGPGLARIPAQARMEFDPKEGWKIGEKISESVDPLKSLFMKPGAFNDLLMTILTQARKNAPGMRDIP
jgi:hypothetical protein